jgi:hypothetical protein
MQCLLDIAWQDGELFAIKFDTHIGQFGVVVDTCCVQILRRVAVLDIKVGDRCFCGYLVLEFSPCCRIRRVDLGHARGTADSDAHD